MEPKNATEIERDLLYSIVPGWGLVQKLKDRIFVRQTRSKEFVAKIKEVVESYGINDFVPEYSRPYFLMRVKEGEFRRILVGHRPTEVFVTDWSGYDEGIRGGIHIHAQDDIVIVSNGYLLTHGSWGMLDGLPYKELERRGLSTWPPQARWVKYVLEP